MSQFLRVLGVLACLLLSQSALAAIEIHEFSNDAQREQFNRLTHELRCPKCQNQNIADSDAMIAANLRRAVEQQVKDGRSDKQIIDYMVERYGEFVLYRPRVERETWLLWFGPAVLLVIGFITIAGIVRVRRKSMQGDMGELSADERERLKQLLDQDTSK